MAIPFRRTAAVMLSIWALSLALMPPMAFAWPTGQTASITYQGLLKSGGAAINGSVDLQFKLFDAAAAGNQIGSTLAANAVVVADGVFTSSLDFGALAFNGEERWLEISVASPAGGGIGPFTTLAPRQPLASAPYAAFALGVNGSTITSLNASNIASGTIANARTTGAASNVANSLVLRDAGGNFSGGTISATLFSGSGASLSSLNAGAVSSGTLNDARLSSNVALLNNAQTISGAKTFTAVPTFSPPVLNPPFLVSSTFKVINLNADLLDGLNSSAFLQAVPNPLALSGVNDGIATIDGANTSVVAASSGVHGLASGAGVTVYGVHGENSSVVGRAVYGESTAVTGQNYGVYGTSPSTSGRGVFGSATAATGSTVAGKFENSSTSGSAVVGTALATTGFTTGVWGDTSSTLGRGVNALAVATTGVTYGARVENASTSGRAVFAWEYADTGATYGVLAQNDSTAGAAVYGNSTALSGFCYGGYFESDSPDGRGVYAEANSTTGVAYGGRFVSSSPDGRGSSSRNLATTGIAIGAGGQTDSTAGYGMYGLAAATTGTNFGVRGETSSGAGYGVYGYTDIDSVAVGGFAAGTTGSNFGVYGRTASSAGRGVWGYASATTGTTYGVYGQASTAATGYAVYANGDMGASGLKPFRIDHPDDPANKYLLHYAAESDEVINFYSGKVTLNGAGEAIVDMPAYFAKINRDPRYTLTAIGAAMPNLHVADEISEVSLLAGNKAEPGQPAEPCWFRIAGGVPGMRVSWEIKAVRNDRYVQKRGAPVEIAKTGLERGTYQHPEFYDQPESARLGYRPDDAEMVKAGRAATLAEPPQPIRPAVEDETIPTPSMTPN